MPGHQERSLLRVSIARGDGAALVQQLGVRPWPDDALQLIGDDLLAALKQEFEEAAGLAGECVSALRVRGWPGDEELADALEARLGTGVIRLLRPLAVDLEELALVLEGDPVHGGGRIDLRTGEVWPQAAIEYAEELGEDDECEDSGRWLWIECEGSRAGYRDMEWFISDLGDPDIADRLSIAISGREVFRRFKDVLSRSPDLMERWFGFADDRQRDRARAWLTDQGYAATPRVLADPRSCHDASRSGGDQGSARRDVVRAAQHSRRDKRRCRRCRHDGARCPPSAARRAPRRRAVVVSRRRGRRPRSIWADRGPEQGRTGAAGERPLGARPAMNRSADREYAHWLSEQRRSEGP
ncbi:MAG: UPF0158 family protein [Nocardioidaceae bacterium]